VGGVVETTAPGAITAGIRVRPIIIAFALVAAEIFAINNAGDAEGVGLLGGGKAGVICAITVGRLAALVTLGEAQLRLCGRENSRAADGDVGRAGRGAFLISR